MPTAKQCVAVYLLTGLSSAPIVIDKKNPRDIVIMCGSPGSGKSTFYWTKLKPLGYERVNQDILKTVSVTCSCVISMLTLRGYSAKSV